MSPHLETWVREVSDLTKNHGFEQTEAERIAATSLAVAALDRIDLLDKRQAAIEWTLIVCLFGGALLTIALVLSWL